MSTESSVKRILKSLMKSIADECDEEFVQAQSMFGAKITERLVAPVLQKVYKDMFPYVCAVAAVLIIILVFVLVMMFMILSRGLLMR